VVLSHGSLLIGGFGIHHLFSLGVLKIYSQTISFSVASNRLEGAEVQLWTFTHPHTCIQ